MESVIGILKDLLSTQGLAVLSTHGGGQPYASLVAFLASADCAHIWFATQRATRKYANMNADSRVALLVDSRQNEDKDFHAARAATAVGIVHEVRQDHRQGVVEEMLRKHPYLSVFLHSPSCALLQVDVETYYVVQRFQEVTEYHLS